MEALALLEPLGPSPELVAALADVARVDAIQGRSEDAIVLAERALGLAAELGLPRPARALGARAMARANLGDPEGPLDFREAIDLATEAGQGREVAMLHNNLGLDLFAFEGPDAALTVLRDGIAYAKARGLTESLDALTGSSLEVLFDTGDHGEALALAAEIAPRLEASGDVFDLNGVRVAQARILALRGEGAAEGVEWLDWLEASSRELGGPEDIVMGLASATMRRASLGQGEPAAALLAELESFPGSRDNEAYSAFLPAMVRTALGIGHPELAERLVSGLEPRSPYAEHALVSAKAALTEARGDLPAAAEAYEDAADRWDRFGVVPEKAFALLGQGRCLIGLSRPTEAAPVLRRAREIFEPLQAAPALAETDALLNQTTALSS